MEKWLNGKIVEMTVEEEFKNRRRREKMMLPSEIQIQDIKEMLHNTDYITCKIVEGEATPEDYKDLIQLRREWREQIRRLEENKGREEKRR